MVNFVEFFPLDSVAQDASLVLLRLPRGLDVLDEQAAAIAAACDPTVIVHAGGMLKHMNRAMNETLSKYFSTLDVSLARQKARGTSASTPQPDASTRDYPRSATQTVNGTEFTPRAGAATFGAQRLQSGHPTVVGKPSRSQRARQLARSSPAATVPSVFMRRSPTHGCSSTPRIISASAVTSSGLSAHANGLSERITAVQDDGLSRHAPASATLVATLNPPFHIGNTVHAGIALKVVR